jgi:hypothetical protein
MESGSNGLIRKFLNDRKLTAEEFSGLKTTINFARSPGETGAAPPKGFLYQAGYLTLRKDSRGTCTLDYPNFEVRSALSALFMDNLCSSEDIGDEVRSELDGYPAAGDAPNLTAVLGACTQACPIRIMRDAFSVRLARRILGGLSKMLKKKPRDLHDPLPDCSFLISMRQKHGKYFCRSALQSCLRGAGAHVRPEARKNRGRSDLEVRYKGQVYIMEIKSAAGRQAAHNGMTRIRELD